MSGQNNYSRTSFSPAGRAAPPRRSLFDPFRGSRRSQQERWGSGFANRAGSETASGGAFAFDPAAQRRGARGRRGGRYELPNELVYAALCLAALVVLLGAVLLLRSFSKPSARLLRAEMETVGELLSWTEDKTGAVSTADRLLDMLYRRDFSANALGRLGGLGASVEVNLSRTRAVVDGASVVSGGGESDGVGLWFAANRSTLQFAVAAEPEDVYGLRYSELSAFLKKLSAGGGLVGLALPDGADFSPGFFRRQSMNAERALQARMRAFLNDCTVRRLDSRTLTLNGEARVCAVYQVDVEQASLWSLMKDSLVSLWRGDWMRGVDSFLRQFRSGFLCYVDEGNRLVALDWTGPLGGSYKLLLEGEENPWSRIRVLRDNMPLFRGGLESDTQSASLVLRDEDGEQLRVALDRRGGGFRVWTRSTGELLAGSLRDSGEQLRFGFELRLPGAPAVELTLTQLTEQPTMLARQYRRVADLSANDYLRIARMSGIRSLDEALTMTETDAQAAG